MNSHRYSVLFQAIPLELFRTYSVNLVYSHIGSLIYAFSIDNEQVIAVLQLDIYIYTNIFILGYPVDKDV